MNVFLMFSAYFSPPIDDFDVFKESKDQNFFESQQSIIALCTHLQQLIRAVDDLEENQLKNELAKLLQVTGTSYMEFWEGRPNPQLLQPAFASRFSELCSRPALELKQPSVPARFPASSHFRDELL